MTGRLNAILRTFPNARHLTITSGRNQVYNCVAYALDIENEVWWPTRPGDARWLPGWPRELTLENFVGVFCGRGYAVCDDGAHIPALEKVAIYAKGATPTHVARQLETGRWTSKLGPDEDVEHDLNDLVGSRYGQPVRFLSRPRRP